jgi:alpha-galactosidase
VRAALEGDRARVYRAAPLQSAIASVLSFSQIRAMVDGMIAAHGPAMPAGIRA